MNKNIRVLLICGIACLLIFFLIAAARTQPPLAQERPSIDDSHVAAPPFSSGEKLVYSVEWDPPWYLSFLPRMKAGEAELQLIGETEYKGVKALKISFKVHSSGMLVKLSGVKVEDEFIFYVEPETFCAISISKMIYEGKRKRQINVEYIRDEHQLYIHEADVSVTPPRIIKDEYKHGIPECVKDPISALYLLRMSELHANYVQTSLIGNDDKIKEVVSRVEKKETVGTPVGKFIAWRINTISLMGGLFKGGDQFKIWVSADQRKLPVQFEAKANLGHVFGKLKEIH
jgi:hypothetical protein